MTTTQWRGKTFKDLVGEAKAQISEVDPATFKQWIAEKKDLVILDVREPADFMKGAIPGALHLPRGVLELEIDDMVPDQDQEIVVYCGGGSRSALAARTLGEMGYEKVHSLAGGWKQWQS
ncbi:MAG: rhodanese-like domain-containing protein [Candidatus Melainabacteria bacterium]